MATAHRRARRDVLQIVKKALLSIVALAATLLLPATPAPAAYNVLLAGGSEPNRIHIALSPDGRQYVIESVVPLEVGGEVCVHPEGRENALVCDAPQITGFEVNSGGGEDIVTMASVVRVPVTMRGGPESDLLIGGSSVDKLIGGAGDDQLIGGAGGDKLIGGEGDDRLRGGAEGDVLLGDSGADVLSGGGGPDLLIGGPGKDLLQGGPAKDVEIQEVGKRR